MHVLKGQAEILDDVKYISFTGDFGLRQHHSLLTREMVAELLKNEKKLLQHFDVNIINLEFVFQETMDSEKSLMLDILQQCGFRTVSLANNHSLDYGPRGISYNQKKLTEAGMSFFGTKDRPYFEILLGGKKVAVFAMTDLIDKEDLQHLVMNIDNTTLSLVRQQLKKFDFATAFVHLISRSEYPSPYDLQKVDELIDAGFQLIVCTGSHWIMGFSFRKEVPVVFGLGNHLFSYHGRFTEQTGMHFVAGLRSGKIAQLFVIPYNNKGVVSPLVPDDFQSFLETFKDRSDFNEGKYFHDKRTLYELKRSIYGYGFLPTKVAFKDFARLNNIEKSRLYLYYSLKTLYSHYSILFFLFILVIMLTIIYSGIMIHKRRKGEKGICRKTNNVALTYNKTGSEKCIWSIR